MLRRCVYQALPYQPRNTPQPPAMTIRERRVAVPLRVSVSTELLLCLTWLSLLGGTERGAGKKAKKEDEAVVDSDESTEFASASNSCIAFLAELVVGILKIVV